MEESFAVMFVIFGSVNVASILYVGIGYGNVVDGVSGRDITLTVFIWRIGPWFNVSVDWSQVVGVVVMGVGMLGLIYHGSGARNVKTGVLGRNILLAMSIWRTGPCFLVAVAYSHIVWVVVTYVGMLGLMLVGVR